MTTGELNAALSDADMCWTCTHVSGISPGVLVDSSAPGADMTMVNQCALRFYVQLAVIKGKTTAEMVTALRALVDGDRALLDGIIAAPNI